VTWTTLLASRDVQWHRTSIRELDDIRALVVGELADAQAHGLSAARRFEGELVRRSMRRPNDGSARPLTRQDPQLDDVVLACPQNPLHGYCEVLGP
jgi:hypothetical protein